MIATRDLSDKRIKRSCPSNAKQKTPLQTIGNNDLNTSTIISWESLLAGYASGTAGLLIGHPLDSFKVLLQNSPSSEVYNNQRRTTFSPSRVVVPAVTTTPSVNGNTSTMAQQQKALHLQFNSPSSMQKRYLLTYDLARCTLRRSKRQQTKRQQLAAANPERNRSAAATTTTTLTKQQNITLRSLYNGIGAPLVTVGLVQSVSFLLYDSLKQILRQQQQQQQRKGETNNVRNRKGEEDRLEDVAVAAFSSGVAISMITNPLVTLKIRQQMGGKYGLDFWSAVRGTYAMPGGIKNFYSGYAPHLVCESVGRSVFFVTYEYLKHLSLPSTHLPSYSLNDNDDATSESTAASASSPTLKRRVLSATCAGMVSSTVVYPVDVVRSRMQGGTATMNNMIRSMWKHEGYKAFVRGYSISVVRSGPVSAVAMPIYDLMVDFLKQDTI